MKVILKDGTTLNLKSATESARVIMGSLVKELNLEIAEMYDAAQLISMFTLENISAIKIETDLKEYNPTYVGLALESVEVNLFDSGVSRRVRIRY